MHRIVGIVVIAVIVLATIWAFNHFSSGGVGALGSRAAPAGS